MKFLLGLILGGMVTVIAAERFTADPAGWGASMRGAWMTWIDSAVGRLELRGAGRHDRSTLPPAEPDPAAGVGDKAAASIGPGPGELVAADTQEPMVQLAGPEPLPPVAGPEPLLHAAGFEPTADPPARAAFEAIQQVWVPFRSQTSAEGFARRLSSETEHPFGIDRRGPGRYQVFFAYADEDERRRLLEQVRPLIGTAAP